MLLCKREQFPFNANTGWNLTSSIETCHKATRSIKGESGTPKEKGDLTT
jgi:hypothetical protein